MKTLVVRCFHCSKFYRVIKVKSLFWQAKILEYAKCPFCGKCRTNITIDERCKLCGVPAKYRPIHSRGLDHACQMKIIRMSQKKINLIQYSHE